MEILHSDQAYVDFVTPIGESDRQDPDFVMAEQSIEALFKDIGAKLVYRIADAGEPPKPLEIYIADERSEAMVAFSNRPA